MHAISWPEQFLPGTTDNYVSNEIILPGLRAAEVWPFINDTTYWPTYYRNVADVHFYDGSGPTLRQGARFRFITFGLVVEAEVTECVPPTADQPGRLAWHGWVAGDATTALDVLHAWLFEDLPGGRVRLLTQETQNGQPAREMAQAKPNPMLNAHQDWLDGLGQTALAQRG